MDNLLAAHLEILMDEYSMFDPAHQVDHVESVLNISYQLALELDVDLSMASVVAIYHDLGLREGRKDHHLTSGRILREDKDLLDYFSPDQIEVMAQAVEDHRASNNYEPRNIYGKIVSDADRMYDFDTIIKRCILHREGSTVMEDREKSFEETRIHITNKYSKGGYLPDFYFRTKDTVTEEKLDRFANDLPYAIREFDRIWYKQ